MDLASSKKKGYSPIRNQVLHHSWISQCGDVSNLIRLIGGDLSQNSSHTFYY